MTALILTTIAIAILSAWYDKIRIAGGHEIKHVPRWLVRAALVSIAAFVFGHPWMVLGLWGLFSAVFRFALNRWRGLDWRYIGPWSNTYDRVFHGIVIRYRHGFWIPADFLGEERDIYFGGRGIDATSTQSAKDDIHRAGTIAYIVEVVAFVVVLWCHLRA